MDTLIDERWESFNRSMQDYWISAINLILLMQSCSWNLSKKTVERIWEVGSEIFECRQGPCSVETVASGIRVENTQKRIIADAI